MGIDVTTIVVFAIIIIALVVFILFKNRKDKEELVDDIENDYHKEHGPGTHGEEDTETFPKI